ncbi:MAG: universal stress protein [Nitrospirae bacterium]|nr:universal stress protein [Nitrospirota bacterium]
MFRHILVPLDGSRMAEAALPAAAFISEEFNAVVTLIHVIERNAPSEVHGQTHLRNTDEATEYLRETALRAFPRGVKVDFHVHTTEVDNVAESIVDHADELHHDLIIMCSHGRGKALHLLFGSIAQKIISLGSLPVLITRPIGDGSIPEFSCRALLLPLDGNPDHEQSLPVSKELARTSGALLHLAVVIPGFGDLSGQGAVTSRFLPGTMSQILEMSVENAEEYLQNHVKEFGSQGIEAIAHVLRGDPAVVIDDSARKLQIDLIVMATHGKTGMDAFWQGSVSHKLSSRSRIPLLLVPVKKAES